MLKALKPQPSALFAPGVKYGSRRFGEFPIKLDAATKRQCHVVICGPNVKCAIHDQPLISTLTITEHDIPCRQIRRLYTDTILPMSLQYFGFNEQALRNISNEFPSNVIDQITAAALHATTTIYEEIMGLTGEDVPGINRLFRNPELYPQILASPRLFQETPGPIIRDFAKWAEAKDPVWRGVLLANYDDHHIALAATAIAPYLIRSLLEAHYPEPKTRLVTASFFDKLIRTRDNPPRFQDPIALPDGSEIMFRSDCSLVCTKQSPYLNTEEKEQALSYLNAISAKLTDDLDSISTDNSILSVIITSHLQKVRGKYSNLMRRTGMVLPEVSWLEAIRILENLPDYAGLEPQPISALASYVTSGVDHSIIAMWNQHNVFNGKDMIKAQLFLDANVDLGYPPEQQPYLCAFLATLGRNLIDDVLKSSPDAPQRVGELLLSCWPAAYINIYFLDNNQLPPPSIKRIPPKYWPPSSISPRSAGTLRMWHIDPDWANQTELIGIGV